MIDRQVITIVCRDDTMDSRDAMRRWVLLSEDRSQGQKSGHRTVNWTTIVTTHFDTSR